MAGGLPAPGAGGASPSPNYPAPATEPAPGYRPALDGVRALAVAAVILYHGGVQRARGGFLGVDVFFVISGYLITALLVRERARSGRIAFGDFYRRRARRLLPALVAMVAAVLVVQRITGELTGATKGDALSALFYVPNWRFILAHRSYFQQFAAPSPFEHTWSLGIEEQWYLVWPVLLAVALGAGGAARARRRLERGDPQLRDRTGAARRQLGVAALALGGALASAGVTAALYDPTGDPSRAYFGTDARAQGLLLGAVLALTFGRLARLPRWALAGLGWAGLASVAAVAMTAPDTASWLYRGGFLAVSAGAGALLLAVEADPRGALGRILGARPAALVGRLSYSLYLWHWPVFVFLTPARAGVHGSPLLGLRIAVTAVLSSASFVLLERPVRNLDWSRVRRGLAVAVVGVAVAAVLLPAATLLGPPKRGITSTPAAATIPEPAASGAAAPPSRPLRVLVVGDSVAVTLAARTPPALLSQVTVTSRALLGCGVVPGATVIGGRVFPPPADCAAWRDDWRAGVAADHPDVVVVLVGAWEVADHRVDGRTLRVGTAAYAQLVESAVRDGLDIVTQAGEPVALLTAPCYHEESRDLGGSASPRNDPDRVAWVNDRLRAAAAGVPGVSVVDLHAYLCPGEHFLAERGGEQLRYDGVHFSDAGAADVWNWLLPQLESLAAPAGGTAGTPAGR